MGHTDSKTRCVHVCMYVCMHTHIREIRRSIVHLQIWVWVGCKSQYNRLCSCIRAFHITACAYIYCRCIHVMVFCDYATTPCMHGLLLYSPEESFEMTETVSPTLTERCSEVVGVKSFVTRYSSNTDPAVIAMQNDALACMEQTHIQTHVKVRIYTSTDLHVYTCPVAAQPKVPLYITYRGKQSIQASIASIAPPCKLPTQTLKAPPHHYLHI